MNKKINIIPAVLSPDFKDVAALINRSVGVVNTIQIDICDGIFTDFLTWPFTKKGVPEIAPDFEMPEWENMNFEADMLVKNPNRYIDTIKNLGFSKVVLHVGSEPEEKLIETVQKFISYDIEVGIGISINKDIVKPIDAYEACYKLDQMEIPFYIQIMGIEKIGLQNQAFSDECIPAIQFFNMTSSARYIQIDGGISDSNVKKLYAAGATSFVVGSWFNRASLSVREGVSVLKNLV